MRQKTDIQELSEFIRDNMVTRGEFKDFVSKFDTMQDTLDEHSRILADHTLDLAIIKNDLKIDVDRRLQLEVRVGKLEAH